MRKLLSFIFAALMLLMLGSCETYAQFGAYDDDIVYEYSYAAYPVRYIDGLAYYYSFHNGIWTWVLLPRAYYPHIRRHYPMTYHRPQIHYNRPSVYRPAPHRHGSVHPDRKSTPNRGTCGNGGDVHRRQSGGFSVGNRGGGSYFHGRR
jgi:hypothetical protein